MSKFIPVAKLITKNSYLTRKLFDFYTQLIVFAPSKFAIKQSRSLAHILGKDRLGRDNFLIEDVFNRMALLRCFELPDSEFIRIGPSHDGGYVIYKDVSQITKVISIGVAEDTAFEEDFNSLNKDVTFYLFDHTVTPKRKLPRNFEFYSQGLGKENVSHFVNLKHIVNTHLSHEDRALLKIDIEGSEYEALSDTSSETLSNFDQLLIELHNLNEETLSSNLFNELLTKIRKNFQLVHIHGNNNDGYSIIRGACVPQTLELTFLNKSFQLREVPGSAIFPRDLDFPNTRGDDLAIGSFKFKTY